MTKVMEHAEHAQHAGHSGDKGKWIGMTMAIIGVLVAITGALIGSQRNEMTRAMIEQTQASGDATSASTKYRLVLVNIENLRGQTDIPQSVRQRFVRLYDDYAQERSISAEWAKAYDPLIAAFFHATEGYEVAQLLAEVGIISASLAVLLGNQSAWYVAILFGFLSVGQIGRTYLHTSQEVPAAEHAVEHAKTAYVAVRKAHSGDNSDAEAVNALDPDGSIRAKLAESLKGGAKPAH